MARHVGPREGSVGFKVICRVIELGGTASLSALFSLMQGLCKSPSMANKRAVLQGLEQHSFVDIYGDVVRATPAGKSYVAEMMARLHPEEVYQGTVATPRTVPLHSPLIRKSLLDSDLRRPGAFEHKNIPSMMGGQRVLPGGGVAE